MHGAVRVNRRHTGCGRAARGRPVRAAALLSVALALLSVTTAPPAADALVHIDFEQKYFVHPGQEVWDFCLVRDAGLYHIFYIAIPESLPNSNCKALGHATSPDLVHWQILPPAVPTGQGWWDNDSVWAPDVVWDETQSRWVMMFTGVDSLKVQRACMAYSPDLSTWTKSPANPVFQPDTLAYFWTPTYRWSSFRDPFLFFADGLWNMLSTAGLRVNGYPGTRYGILHRSTSTDFVNWTDAGPFFTHDGSISWHDLESSQFIERGGWYHLFFTEQDVQGVSHIVSDSLGGWHMADRQVIDYGNAAEINQFDAGIDIFSRYAIGQHPKTGAVFRVVRFDTLHWGGGGQTPIIYRPHPLDRDWVFRSGTATLGNPTFGDNPVERGEPSCGLVGNGWFGSQEYYQGPLSGRGSPGTRLGDSATGQLDSYPFFIEGDFIKLLVGGGHYPQTCYVALMDAGADTILVSETGDGVDLMTQRIWNVRPYRGRLAYLRILDNEAGPLGHINVDEIHEVVDSVTAVPPSPGSAPPVPPLILRGARPNPFNPATEVGFSLARPGRVCLTITDARGRLVWRTEQIPMLAGPHAIAWRGLDATGRAAASGLYLYSLSLDGTPRATGKLSLVR